MLFLDTEGMGFCGPTLLYQYADGGDAPVELWDVFYKPVRETLELLEWFMTKEITCWNLTFDMFHVVQQFNVLLQIENKSLPPYPEEYADIEFGNPCTHFLRPKAALDLMIHSVKDQYQFLMNRRPFRIKLVPRNLAEKLADALNQKIEYESILFYKYSKKESVGWEVIESIPARADFVDVIVRFNPSRSLDAIGDYVLGEGKDPLLWDQLPPLVENQWMPYGGNWVDVADYYIDWWRNNKEGRRYAVRDVVMMQELWNHFGRPPAGDYNSELCVVVANSRWKGFSVDEAELQKSVDEALEEIATSPVNVNSSRQVLKWLRAGAEPAYAPLLIKTDKATLKSMTNLHKGRELGRRCQRILELRKAHAHERTFKKFKKVRRLHPDYTVFGTLSDRMSGRGGFNAMAINKRYRRLFTMADEGEELQGGDFSAFEVSIAQAVYQDENMRQELLKGSKIHAQMAADIFGMDYEDILLTEKGVCGKCDGTGIINTDDSAYAEEIRSYGGAERATCDFCEGSGEVDAKYDKGKASFFASMYGAQALKLSVISGLPIAQTEEGLESFYRRFPGMAKTKRKIERDFTMVRFWHKERTFLDPCRYVESMYGHRRYFDLEIDTVRSLFYYLTGDTTALGGNRTKCVRREVKGAQTQNEAARSAIFGAMMGIQSSVQRQAGNHIVQSPGATLNKELQLLVWKTLQPVGVHPVQVRVINNHDELVAVTAKGVDLTGVVAEFVEEKKKDIPLLEMQWDRNQRYWGSKSDE